MFADDSDPYVQGKYLGAIRKTKQPDAIPVDLPKQNESDKINQGKKSLIDDLENSPRSKAVKQKQIEDTIQAIQARMENMNMKEVKQLQKNGLRRGIPRDLPMKILNQLQKLVLESRIAVSF